MLEFERGDEEEMTQIDEDVEEMRRGGKVGDVARRIRLTVERLKRRVETS